MLVKQRNHRLGRLAAFAVGAIALGALAIPMHSARAQYLGWDFGNGFGVGVGAPPSAYGYYYDNPYYRPYYRPYSYRPYPYYDAAGGTTGRAPPTAPARLARGTADARARSPCTQRVCEEVP